MSNNKQAWLMVAGLWITLAILWATAVPTTGLFIKPISQVFHTDRAQVSLISSLLALGTCVGSLVSGWLIGFIDPRRVMLFGAILMGLVYLVASQVASFAALLGCYVILGTAIGLSTLIPASFIIGNWFGEGRAGLAMGITMTGNSLSSVGSVMAIDYVITHFGWRATYVALAVPIFVVELPIILMLRSRPPQAQQQQASHSTPAALMPGLEVHEAVRTREFWLIVISQFIFGWVANAILTHLVPYLQGLGYSRIRAAGCLSIVMGLTSLGKISTGFVADRIGARWAVMADFLLESVGIALLIGAAQMVFLAPAVICYGLTWGTPLALLPLLTIESLGLRRYGAIAGMTNVAFTIGNALGALTTGWVFDVTGSYVDAFIGMAIVTLLTAIAAGACRPLRATNALRERAAELTVA